MEQSEEDLIPDLTGLEEDGLYAIDWLDSGMQISLGWDTAPNHLANWKLNDMRVSTVGRLAYEDDDVIALSLSKSGDQIFGLQLIVKNNIISIVRLTSG